MKVTELSVENFKRIVAVNIKLNQHVTEISGPNEAGKSSTIDALWTLLKGKTVAPPEPIRKGAERCTIRGRIGELLVTRQFRKSKSGEITTDLRIERGKESFPPTERQLRDLIGEHMLDPGDFIALDSKGKFDVLRAFVPGVDFDLIARQDRTDYDKRRDLNRFAEQERAAAAAIIVPADTPEEQVDEAALIAELEKAGEDNRQIEARKAHRERAALEARNARSTADAQRSEAKRLREEADELDHRAASNVERAENLEKQLAEAGPLPPIVDTAPIRERIRKAQADNANVRKREERTRHESKAEEYEKQSEALTAAMKKREADKRAAIAAAKIPVPGIEFGDGEILLNGVPFEQASTAQKFRVGVAIAVAKNPKLRLVWVRDASLLDDRSYQLIEKLSEEFDCQILLETVRAIGKDAIVLENGHVKQAADETPQAALV